MEHTYIKLDKDSQIQDLVIYQKDNNLDGKDNLNELPVKPAIYAICGRVNGQPVNPRYVGETENLQESVQSLFDKNAPAIEGNECFKEFMLSIKIKTIIYLAVPDLPDDERLKIKKEWQAKYDPKCNEELNEIH